MTSGLKVAISDVEVEADGSTAVDLVFGLTATLEISQAGNVWRNEYFPVLELAVALTRLCCAVPFAFTSMSIEEQPALTGELQGGDAVLLTYDGERFVAPVTELREALWSFVTDVDKTVRAMSGRNLVDIEKALRS